MLDSIYIGMSGLSSFSKGLSNISGNVANLNTPGFKGSQLEFLDLFYRYQYSGSNQHNSSHASGSGVEAGASYVKFTQGEFRQTGNDLNVAIDGNGFFILNKEGKTFYTRSGQFAFDSSGFLTAREDGARVAGVVGGRTTEINISGRRSNPALATSAIKFDDTLSVNSTDFDVANITAFDSLGKQHTFTLELINDSANVPGRWTFELLEGATQVATGEIRYNGSGEAVAGFESTTFTYAPSGGANSTQITLDFSDSDYLSASSSTLKVRTQDGHAAGFLTKTSIDTDGFLNLSYSNGQSVRGGQLALASFSDLTALQAQGGNRFIVFGETGRSTISAPGGFATGRLLAGGIELSNVNLAQEFSELIIVQRAYQASSQVISAANEMIQQLGEIRGRR